MAYPLNVKTRLVSFGGAATVEAGIPLHIRISTESSRSLIWVENGYRLESLAALYMSATDGQEIIFEVPTTDQNGWLDAATRQAIIVEPGEASHLYTTKLEIFTEDHELIRTYEIGPYAVPEGPGTLDADLLNPNYDPIEGTLTVYIPGPDGELSAAGQQAAADAIQAAIDAEGYRDEAEEWRDQAEVFAGSAVAFQDAAMAGLTRDPNSLLHGAVHDEAVAAFLPVGDVRYEPQVIASTISSLPTSNLWIAHHGGGAFPSATMPSAILSVLQTNVARGAKMVDLDVQSTRDGVLVNYHDISTGAYCEYDVVVTDTTYNQLPRVNVSSRLGAGWLPERIPTLNEIFAQLGRKVCFNAEMKTNGSATLPPFAELVRQYSLVDSVVVNFAIGSIGFAPAVKAEGLMFHVTGCTTVGQVEDAIDAGAHMVGIRWDAAPTLVDAALEIVAARDGNGRIIAEGSPGAVFGLWSKSQREGMDSRIHGYWNDAPGYVEVDEAPLADSIEMPLLSMRGGDGWLARNPYDLPNPAEWLTSDGIVTNDGAVTNQISLRDLAGPRGTSGWYEFTVVWDQLPSVATQYVGVKVLCPIDIPASNPASPAHNGYVAALRSNGHLVIQSTVGGSLSGIGSATGTALTPGVPVKCRFEWTPTTVKLTRLDTNETTGNVANSDWRGEFIHTVTTCVTGKSRVTELTASA